MRAVVFDGTLRVEDNRPTPEPPPGEARLWIRLAGICSTDLAIVSGYKGWRGVLGHEFVGIVDAVGSSSDTAWVGRRVVGEINIGCGRCPRCKAGGRKHCDQRTALGIFGRDGAFATWCVLPIENLHVVPDAIGDEIAVFTEPLAAALEVLEQLHVRPDSRAAVVGDGKLGLLLAQVLASTGADVALVGHHPERLGLLRGVRAAKSGERFPLVAECTGVSAGFEEARSRLEAGGRLVLKSTHLHPPAIDWAGLMVDEITLVGSRCGPFAPALRLLETGKVDVSKLVSASYPLERAVDAFAAARGNLKILLRPDPAPSRPSRS